MWYPHLEYAFFKEFFKNKYASNYSFSIKTKAKGDNSYEKVFSTII